MGQMDIFKSIITKCCVRQIILASYFSRLMYFPRRYHCIPMCYRQLALAHCCHLWNVDSRYSLGPM